MNCFDHPTQAAVATCIVCNKGLCLSCVHIEKDVNAYSSMSYCALHASDVRSRVAHHDLGASVGACFLGIVLIVIGTFFGWSITGIIIVLVGALITALGLGVSELVALLVKGTSKRSKK